MGRTIAIALVAVLAGTAAADRVAEPAQPPANPAPAGRRASRPSDVPLGHEAPNMGAPGMGAPLPSRPAPPPPPPVVAPEIRALGRQLAGRYTCKGVMLHADGSSNPLRASLTIELDLEDAWIRGSYVEAGAGGMRLTDYRTYDAIARRWTRIQLASTSGHVLSTSLGEQNGTWTWQGAAESPQGTIQVRDYEQRGGKQLRLWGEALLGGRWQKQYDVTCRR
jgi:hypothetical protein